MYPNVSKCVQHCRFLYILYFCERQIDRLTKYCLCWVSKCFITLPHISNPPNHFAWITMIAYGICMLCACFQNSMGKAFPKQPSTELFMLCTALRLTTPANTAGTRLVKLKWMILFTTVLEFLLDKETDFFSCLDFSFFKKVK